MALPAEPSHSWAEPTPSWAEHPQPWAEPSSSWAGQPPPWAEPAHSWVEPPRPSVPPGDLWPTAVTPDPNPSTPGQVAAGIATGVLCLWAPFTLIIGFVVDTVPNCAGSAAAICTPLGHLTAVFGGIAGALLGLAIVVIGCWVHPRRDHGYWAFVALAVAGIGFLAALGMVGGAPGE